MFIQPVSLKQRTVGVGQKATDMRKAGTHKRKLCPLNCPICSISQICGLDLCGSKAELLDMSWAKPPVEQNAHRSRSISDVSSFSTVSVLRFYMIRVRALCV